MEGRVYFGLQFESTAHHGREYMVSGASDDQSYCICSQEAKSNGYLCLECFFIFIQPRTPAQGIVLLIVKVGLPTTINLIYNPLTGMPRNLSPGQFYMMWNWQYPQNHNHPLSTWNTNISLLSHNLPLLSSIGSWPIHNEKCLHSNFKILRVL